MSSTPWQDEHAAAVAQTARRRRETSTKRQPATRWSPLYQDAFGGWWVNDRYYGHDFAAASLAVWSKP